MSKVKVDMSGVETFVRCEEGKHPMIIKGIELKQTQNGDDMLTATLEVTSGESKGARIIDNYTITPKALWKLKQVLDAIGGFKTDGRLLLDTDKMLNKPILVEVAHEEYNGQTRARALSYSKVGAAPAAKAETPSEKASDDDEWDEA